MKSKELQQNIIDGTAMPIFYSKSKPAFYCVGIHGDAIPKDAVAITREKHKALLDVQAQGKLIRSDENGYPIAVDPPPLTPKQLAEIALNQRQALMNEATSKIAPLQDAVEFDIATAGEEKSLKAWKLYRIALNRIEQQAGFPTQIDWPKVPEAA